MYVKWTKFLQIQIIKLTQENQNQNEMHLFIYICLWCFFFSWSMLSRKEGWKTKRGKKAMQDWSKLRLGFNLIPQSSDPEITPCSLTLATSSADRDSLTGRLSLLSEFLKGVWQSWETFLVVKTGGGTIVT